MFHPDTAHALLHSSPGQDVPAVPASSRLVEVMELAAARLMRSRLRDGESSVAMSTRLQHAALSRAREGAGTLRARAHCDAIDGRLYRFTVHVFDESGLVASGEHVRALVSERRIEALARRRAGRASMLLNA